MKHTGPPMTKPKTQKNSANVDKFLAGIEDVHIPTLKKLIKKAYKSPAIAGATID